MIKTLKELKLHLPAEKRHGYKSTTLSTLKYALRCVKQVEGTVVSFQSGLMWASANEVAANVTGELKCAVLRTLPAPPQLMRSISSC